MGISYDGCSKRSIAHSVEEAIRICDPDVELTTLFDRIGGPRFRGHQGVRDWFARVEELWAFVEVADWRVEDLDDWVLMTGTARLRGRASPDVIEAEWAAAGKIADHRFVKFGIYLTRGEAVAAIEAG